jgi:cytoskeletal protein CcmA (bactofilin family)
MNSFYMDNDRTEEFLMHYFIMTKNRFIRYGALAIFCASMSMSSMASAEHLPTVYSGAAVTLGANANVFGDIQSVAAVTLGDAAEVGGSILAGAAVTVEKDGKVAGDVTAGDAATLGAGASVLGDVAARAEVSIGAQSEVSGDVTSSRGIKLGAAAKVFGNTTAVDSVTLGAAAEAGNDGLASSVRTMSGPIILGAQATVKGDAKAGTIISIGAAAKVTGVETQHAVPEDFANKAESPVAKKTDELTQIQEDLSTTVVEPYTELGTTIATSREFSPGVYHASALTTAAGVTLTFVGSGLDQADDWLVNVDTYLSFGANVTIDLVDVAEGSTIIFNAGTYTTIGANSIFRGTIFTGTYITTGAHTTLAGVGSNCGGLFAINGAITIGAHGTVGGEGCWQTQETAHQGDVAVGNDDADADAEWAELERCASMLDEFYGLGFSDVVITDDESVGEVNSDEEINYDEGVNCDGGSGGEVNSDDFAYEMFDLGLCFGICEGSGADYCDCE